MASSTIRHRAARRRARPHHALATVEVVLFGVAVLSGCSAPTGPAVRSGPGSRGAVGTVVHVVDGDTVDVDFGHDRERVRLLGMDTPETVKPNTPVQCWGPEASARTKALLPIGTVVLAQRDVEARDKYGRLLLYLWRARDGLFINRSLVIDGYARILSIDPNVAHKADLAAAALAADRADRGLWGHCAPEPK